MQPYPASVSPLIGQSCQHRWRRVGLLAGAVVFATVLSSSAVPLVPSDSVAPPGIPGTGSTIIRDLALPFEIRNGTGQLLLYGNVQDRVGRLTSSGDLVFRPRLRDLVATSAGAGFYFLELKLTGYSDTSVDVSWVSDGSGTIAPSMASRDPSGDEVTFLYPTSALIPPSESRFCALQTNAPAYHLAGRITIIARHLTGQTYTTTLEGTAAPTRLQVYPGGTIQAAIDAAEIGETVVVHAGTYNESLTLRPEINVKGDSAGLVFLQPPTDPGVTISNCSGTEFSGFTVKFIPGSGATTGILASGGSPLVKNNIVTGFSRYGIRLLSGCTAIVCGNRIQNNGDSGNAYLDYGIISLSSIPLISNNLISGNECGCYIGWHESDGTQFSNNTVVDNTDAGLWCYQSNPVVKNNIVTGNLEGIHASFASATPVLTYNDSWNNTYGNYTSQQTGVINIGAGSISVDPLFATTSPGNYWLGLTSPCRNAGDPAAIYNDLDGSRNDMGWSGGPCASPDVSAAPFGGFLFTSVGNIPASYIGVTDGLATVPDGDADALRIPRWNHAPFGSQPYLFGVFGSGVNPNYYTIECRLHGTPEGSFAALDHPLSKVRYTLTSTGFTSSVESVGPLWASGVPYYLNTINGGIIYWANDSLRLILNSYQLADGIYDFRIKAYDWAFMPISLSGTANSLTLRINNKVPTVEILSIARENGSLISPCGIVNLTGPQENLRFQITASHADGFLYDYKLQALRGRNINTGVIASDSHPLNHSGQPSWTGVIDSPVYTLPAMPPLLDWETCAYQFHLSSWARTTNGYGRIYYNEFFWNLALNRNPADLDGDGDVDGDDLNIFAGAYGSSNNQAH